MFKSIGFGYVSEEITVLSFSEDKLACVLEIVLLFTCMLWAFVCLTASVCSCMRYSHVACVCFSWDYKYLLFLFFLQISYQCMLQRWEGDLLELFSFEIMASGLRDSRGNTVGVDLLHDKMNDMKIWGNKVYTTWILLRIPHLPFIIPLY